MLTRYKNFSKRVRQDLEKEEEFHKIPKTMAHQQPSSYVKMAMPVKHQYLARRIRGEALLESRRAQYSSTAYTKWTTEFFLQ